MIRRLPLLLLALLSLPLVSQAQDAPPRSVEVRIVALSRGYMRPMRATAERMSNVDGIEKSEPLGFEGDSARYRVTTRLDNQGIAEALQLKVLGEGTDTLTLAAVIDARARHAEARGVLMQIALKISEQPRPNWRGTAERVFDPAWDLDQKMRHLGLSPELLNGAVYKRKSYHIDEYWQSQNAEYKIWVGDKYEGVNLPNNDDPWGDSSDDPKEVDPDPESDFVGIHIYRGPWDESINWVDVEGLQLNGYEGERSDTDSDGELYVKQGADWLTSVLQATAGLRLQNPKGKIADLPHGTGWRIFQDFNDDDLQRWGQAYYNISDFRMRWRSEDGSDICNLRAHYPAHPFYIEAEVDVTSVVGDYQKRKEKDSELDLRKVTRPEIDEALTWICAPEDSVEVFNQRRREAVASMKLIREALQTAIAEHSLDDLCGRLDDPELVKRLGLALKADGEFKPGDYTIRAQMLGDVELSVGTVRSGGRWWQLVSVADAEVLRSNQ